MSSVVVLNATHEPLGVVSLRRAQLYLVRERAVIVEAVPGETWRAGEREFDVPRVVRFVRYVKIPYRWRVAAWSRAGVLRRDNWVCAYCDKRGTTVDHIMPVSRGGRNEWLNTVACCARCNSRKADKTPHEARMPLRFHPREVTQRDTLIVAIAATGADLSALGIACTPGRTHSWHDPSESSAAGRSDRRPVRLP